VASLVVGWPLALPWTYDTHDGHYAYYNAAQFDRALRDGQVPVRWLPDVFGGRGEPVFLYYHPLFFYLVSALHTVGLGFIASIKLLVLLTLPASGWAMLRWLEEHVPTPAAAVGAVAYVAAPIHVVELHVKGDPPAALAFVLAPLVLLAIRKTVSGTARSVAFLSLASAGLVLAHSVSALILLPAFALYALLCLRRPLARRALLRLGAGVALGALVSLWHWGPALAERGLVYIDSVRGILFFDWREQFVAWWQLLSPLWGYHGSFAGTPDDMPFQIGPAHLAAIGVAAWAWRLTEGGRRRFVVWGLASAALAVLMTLAITRPVWEWIDTLDYVQYPFRFLMPLSVACAALAAAAAATHPSRLVVACAALPPILTSAFAIAERSSLYGAIAAFQVVVGAVAIAGGTLDRRAERRGPPALAALFAVLALPWSAVPLHARIKEEPGVIPVHEADLTPDRVRLGLRRTTARDDYLPRAVDEEAIPDRDPAQEYLPPRNAFPHADVEIRSGDMTVSAIRRTAATVDFEVDTEDGGIVVVNLHEFPGWEATLAGPPEWHAVPLAIGTDRTGRMALSIPPGQWRIAVRWRETPFRRRCDLASAAGLIIVALAAFLPAAARPGRRAS
jgi:hypothetical protein